MSAVSFRDVTLGFGGRPVLSGVDLEIPDGLFVGLLGPNGAGKTTLLRAILGLVTPQAGSLSVDGAPVRRGHAQIGYMPQARAASLLVRLSGRDFVASAWRGQRWGLPLTDRAARWEVARALDLVEAGELALRPLGDLSGGERQRLLLAQALLGRPRLLLLDEPLISLDLAHQHQAVTLVRRVQRELGITVLFSAHELNSLLGVMDQVLYLGRGQAALGSVAEIITGSVLSRLYGAAVDVVHAGGRIFVIAGQDGAPSAASLPRVDA